MSSKLAGWRMGMLSFAGRVALLKSVLISLPVYYMTVAKIPTRTISEMTKIARKFMWGKIGSDRYLSLIVWHKVCADVENGGLGIRDFKLFNQALLMKLVWQIASGADKVWVPILKAKYFPRGSFWATLRTANSSQLWKAIQNLKPLIKDQLQWHVGDGFLIAAVNEPWHSGWEIQRGLSNARLSMTVADLFYAQSDKWNEGLIEEVLGPQAVQTIIQAVRKPEVEPLLHDRLIWVKGKSGKYTVKEGYKVLKQHAQPPIQYSEEKIKAWTRIWSWEGLTPRVEIFLWKAVHNGLAIVAELHRRIKAINPTCPRCHSENEFLNHMIFFRSSSRAAWFGSELSMRVDHVHLDFTKALLDLTANIDDHSITVMCNLMWCIWKARNVEIFAAKKTSTQTIVQQAKQMEFSPTTRFDSRVQRKRPLAEPQLIPQQHTIMLTDSSWDNQKRAGWGMLAYSQEGQFRYAIMEPIEASDPLMAEAMALKFTLMNCQQPQRFDCQEKILMVSDCQTLVNQVNNKNLKHRFLGSNRTYSTVH